MQDFSYPLMHMDIQQRDYRYGVSQTYLTIEPFIVTAHEHTLVQYNEEHNLEKARQLQFTSVHLS